MLKKINKDLMLKVIIGALIVANATLTILNIRGFQKAAKSVKENNANIQRNYNKHYEEIPSIRVSSDDNFTVLSLDILNSLIKQK